jgi:hypothetical protein
MITATIEPTRVANLEISRKTPTVMVTILIRLTPTVTAMAMASVTAMKPLAGPNRSTVTRMEMA